MHRKQKESSSAVRKRAKTRRNARHDDVDVEVEYSPLRVAEEVVFPRVDAVGDARLLHVDALLRLGLSDEEVDGQGSGH